jgi:acetoin utilization deacetylase AcuC-like enzyme/nucleotide-binding universal stress UspA family protein
MGSLPPHIRTILCMVDPSPSTSLVIAWSAHLAQRTGAELCLFHAINKPRDQLHPTVEFERSRDLSTYQEKTKTAIEALVPALEIPWRLETALGDPAEAVTDFCHHHPVDLIVAGSAGVNFLKRLFMGTVVERLTRMVACPVLVLRPGKGPPDKPMNFAVCCDLSEVDRPLTRWGGFLARVLEGRLSLLNVMESAVNEDVVEPSSAPYGQVQQMLQDKLGERLRQAARKIIGPEVDLQVHQSTVPTADGLLDLVAQYAVDLVIVGVRHHSAIGKLVVGSTTEALLRKAPCHVLTVPAPLTVPKSAVDPEAIGFQLHATGVVSDLRYLEHRSDADHAENHHRLDAVHEMLDRLQGGLPLIRIAPRLATEGELEGVHAAVYIQKIQDTAQRAYSQLTPDTYACSASYKVASLAAGGVLAGIDAVVAGKVQNALILARPPGHHAEAARAQGFCLFNNTAIGARYARHRLGMDRVLIVDWDLHHGNGTQHIFEDDPTVLYFSSHQYPLFPGTGHLLEVGRGRGEGYTVNVPLRKGLGDGELAFLYQKLLVPIALTYKPDLVLVSAGFDLHKKDPLGKMKLTPVGFSTLTRIAMEISAACCQSRLVLVLEGGYHQQALAESVKAVLAEMCDQTHCNVVQMAAKANRRRVAPIIHRCTEVMKQYWPCLQETADFGAVRKQRLGLG